MIFAPIILSSLVFTNSVTPGMIAARETGPSFESVMSATNSSGLAWSYDRGHIRMVRTKSAAHGNAKKVDCVWRVAFDNSPDRRPRKASKKTLTNKPKKD